MKFHKNVNIGSKNPTIVLRFSSLNKNILAFTIMFNEFLINTIELKKKSILYNLYKSSY